MLLFRAEIARAASKHIQLAAPDHGAAQEAARLLLRPGDKLLAIRLVAERPSDPRAALDHLTSRDFLNIDGQPCSVEEWLQRAEKDATLNRRLAVAGLRVSADRRVAIGSPGSIPALAAWFRGTAWEGSVLLPLLDQIPGARRENASFCGIRSRAVSLPFSCVVPA